MKRYLSYLLLATLVSILGVQAEENLVLSYTIPLSEQINTLADFKILPSSGNASNFQQGENIDKSFDGNFSTIYHSSYNNTVFPISLSYNFTNVDQIDYLIYHPRTDHSNGNFKEIEIWYTLQNGQRTRMGEYNFKGNPNASIVNFASPLIKPVKIEVIVKSGVGDNQTGYACCAEMEFYKKNTEKDDFLQLFKDKLATELKPAVGMEDIKKIANPFLCGVATDIYENRYTPGYRLGQFKPYPHLKVLEEELIANAYNKYENPTGIYFNVGKHLVIADNIPAGQSVNLLIPDYRFLHGGGNIRSRSYPISNGINVIDVTDWDGLGYVSYFTDKPSENPDVKIHFVRGTEHGYFDITKHTNADWEAILNKATAYPVLDLVGRHCQLTFPIEDYRTYSQGKPEEVINAYDSIVTYEHRFLGLEKYNRRPANKVLCRINYSYFMYKDGDGASFEKSTMWRVINPDRILSESWGMTHEIGHIHQMKFVTWSGMGEVSVNFPNLYVNWLHPASDHSTNMSRQKARRAMTALYKKGIAHANYKTSDYNMYKLAPFAILFHYMRQELNRADFYADLYETLRNSKQDTQGWNVADYELFFIKNACDVAQLNLVPFFENWGFLYATDIDGRKPLAVEDYSAGTYTLPSAKITELKNYISDKKYRTPDADNEIMIDRVINAMTSYDF